MNNPKWDIEFAAGSAKKVLILGGGFGGVYCAKKLESLASKWKLDIEITLVSKQNFFVFTPMLPQVVSGMIESNHVVVPVRQVLTRSTFYEADVTSIDAKEKKVKVRVMDGLEMVSDMVLEYDQLVVSLGSDTNFANMPHIKEFVFTLKNLKDALVLRNHVIDMLERAEMESDEEKRKRLLCFVIVGGGLSGIETAAELNSFLQKVLKYYPNLRVDPVTRNPPFQVIVVQSRDRILPEVNAELAAFTVRKMREQEVNIILNSKVVDVRADSAVIADKQGKHSIIPTETVIWTTGVSPNSVLSAIPCEKPSTGRLPVDQFLRVSGSEEIWAVGDCAHIIKKSTGEPYPPTAQHALREAELAAWNIACKIHRKESSMKNFDYTHDAQMAIIGEKTAIASIAGVNVSGFLVWCLWRTVYLKKLPMLKKRLRVAFDWFIDLFFDPDLTHIRGLKEEPVLAPISNSNTDATIGNSNAVSHDSIVPSTNVASDHNKKFGKTGIVE